MSTRTNTPAKPVIVWEQPPPPASRGLLPLKDRATEQLDALAAKPNEWARILEYASASGAAGASTTLRRQTSGYEYRWAKFNTGSALWARNGTAAH